jgi:hypothetical protein
MLNRICTYPISDDHRAKEIETIKKIAKMNGYGKKFIDQMYQHHLKKKQLRDLSYFNSVFKIHQIKMVHSTRGKLGELLGNPKDQVEPLQKSGIYWDVLLPTLNNPDAASQQDSTTITETLVKVILSKYCRSRDQPYEWPSKQTRHQFRLKEVQVYHLDAFESSYILKAKKEGKVLLNNDDANVNSTLFSQHLNFLISLTRALSENESLAPEINKK